MSAGRKRRHLDMILAALLMQRMRRYHFVNQITKRFVINIVPGRGIEKVHDIVGKRHLEPQLLLSCNQRIFQHLLWIGICSQIFHAFANVHHNRSIIRALMLEENIFVIKK